MFLRHTIPRTENKLPNIDVHDQYLVLDMVHSQVEVDRRLERYLSGPT